MLTIDNVSKQFAGVRAVDGCSFQVESAKITGLIGPNGAGKTTLFNIIAGFIKPTAGRITLKDQDVTGLQPHQLFKLGVVRTFQIPREFGRMTVLENLMIVPPQQLGENLIASWLRWRKVLAEEDNIRRKADEVLDYLNLTHLRNDLAQGLSGGQKKLLELGRTLMIDPEIILLDEPGAGVNKTLLRELSDIIERLNQERGCTFCIIDHDLELMERLCDRIVVMAQGKVLAEGTMATVRQNVEVQAAYLGNV
ncbi:ABC transporter ATP-binding protein [Pseudanabaena sp. FACHB-2040]|uniref:ABC transporter ATP-binding protein n=1 Tax=Pseudanabaena sp. FACHB-2040 TaxID=2692859 RepID=UPI0016899676|nr:ABC transporter ATP-binding protein [Pseudanabaena sp. FACHB-2040]MBD0269654.1 ABC transporter ATP-binding protein [Cyanobacteria bacterium Co-bin8]MBD2256563.1 ABC transporter ATP-binding protein [Pseudanabaena sp. FACHB-2040]